MARTKCAAFVCFAALALLIGSAQAATPVFVDGGGLCAGMAPCFTTIQEAVNNAGPPPAEVFIFPGTYAESVDLSTMGSVPGPTTQGDISLSSVNAAGVPTRDTATIDPGAGGGPGTGEAIFTSSPPFSGDVTLTGLRWTSPDADGVDINLDGDLVLSEVTGFDATFDGADFTVTGAALVRDSTFSDNGNDGIELVTGGTVLLEGCRADGNGGPVPDNDDDGFDVRAADDITMRRCDADRNAGSGVQLDERDDEEISVLVTDTNCDLNLRDGLSVNVPEREDGATGTTDVTCIRCGADDNQDDGIAIWAQGTVLIQHSHGNRNGKNGIQVNSDSDFPGRVDVTIEDSVGHRNTGLDGIKVGIGVIRDIVVRRSHAHFNAKDGFKLGLTGPRTDSILVEDCTANDNGANNPRDQGGDGFTLVTQNTDDGSIVMERCRAERNGLREEDGDGFQIWSVGDVTLRDCYAGANGNDGFKIRPDRTLASSKTSGGTITIERCVAENNGDTIADDDGFDFDWDGPIFVRDSAAIGNYADGFQFASINDSAITVDIRGARAEGNGTDSNGDGYDFEGLSGPVTVVMVDSEANGNRDDGVDMDGLGPITIRGFTANGNGTPGSTGDDGIDIDGPGDTVVLEGITANDNLDDGVSIQSGRPENVYAQFIRAERNAEDGVQLGVRNAEVEMVDVCVRSNGADGIFVPEAGGLVSIVRADALGNTSAGICFRDIPDADTSLANISNNSDGMVLSGFAGSIDAVQNFWGAADGPAPVGSGNPVVDGNSGGGTGTITFAPFAVTTVDNGTPCAPPPAPQPNRPPQAGDEQICGTARPNLGDECLEACAGTAATDECFGTSGSDEDGNFCIELDDPLADGAPIVVRDVCSRTTSAPFVVPSPSPAPAMSTRAVAAALVILMLGAALSIRRRRTVLLEN